MKKIDIIATIGPASMATGTMGRMAAAGMTIGRINTKYGSRKQYAEMMDGLRAAGCRIMLDFCRPAMLGWICKQKYDFLAVSFAGSPEQIRRLRKKAGRRVRIVSKIEDREGIKNIDGLIKESDGIMVARGDLGKNIPIEKLPVFQKLIIRKCNRGGKMAITATEMLLSMTRSATPERAEVSDVANAVLDGSDALMLSEETAIGKHPVLAVATMKRIIDEIQRDEDVLGYVLKNL